MKRIAPPSIIADAAATLLAQIESSTRLNGEREPYSTATVRALSELVAGVRIDPTEEGYRVASRSRAGLAHYVARDVNNGRWRCDCEAGLSRRACWHVPAITILERVQAAQQPDPPLPLPPAPRDLGQRLAAARARREAQTGQRQPIPTATKVQAAQAQRAVDELFPE